uniref:beta-galactosidase n=1 Tax=Sphingobacterium sp. (strain 21) TaxID=743722 RepID=F4C6M4_SPHS2
MHQNGQKSLWKYIVSGIFIAFGLPGLLWAEEGPYQLNLAGRWAFQIDQKDEGVQQQWFSKHLTDQITLPGSMNTNGKGDDITLETPWTGSIYDSSFYFNPRLAKYREPGNIKIPFWLTPNKYYVGVAWYQKEIMIPDNWQGKNIRLLLERAHIETQVWIDDQYIGKQHSLVAAHEYDLSTYLKPGKHRISVRIDNRLDVINVGPDSHSVSDHTQGNWNGLIGELALLADDPVYIAQVDVYPDVQKKKAKVVLKLINTTGKVAKGDVRLQAKSFNSKISHETTAVQRVVQVVPGKQVLDTLLLDMGEDMLFWDEFHPALYRLQVSFQGADFRHCKAVEFGMREFKIKGRQFLINGHPVFLRGTVHSAESPLTGYPAMDMASWMKIFKVAKAYGLNHIRFHSWCPPEAAFKAADRVGLYLQPEGPSWPNHGVTIGKGLPIDKYLYEETNSMVAHYGNYASFTMLSAGNEPAGNQVAYLKQFIDYWKAKQDNRRVYTGMSVGGSWPVIPNAEYQVRGGVRGLPWTKLRPESLTDYREGIAAFEVPFVAHEMGQWCAFPNFAAIQKFTGAFKARNFELFQEDLQDQGMADQAHQFLMASGKLQALCYKHEIERALRTPSYAGFQLLGLQDFPGQGTALVGVLDCFWQEKGYIDAKAFARFCNATVPLAKFPKFVYENQEHLQVDIALFHAGEQPLSHPLIQWAIKNDTGEILKKGQLKPERVEIGNGIPIGHLAVPLAGILMASKWTLEVALAGTTFKNDWNFWVYPSKKETMDQPPAVFYTDTLDEKTQQLLLNGAKVFLNAAGKVRKGKEIAMTFQPVFWNTSWFKMRPPHVTGMLIQQESKAFRDFPTAYYSDLQWWEIANNAQVMNMEDFPKDFRPLVQPIDTWFMNRHLALIYEARVGKGKLMVSSADLRPNLIGKPAALQLYRSLTQYMASEAFQPRDEVSLEVVNDIFTKPSRTEFNMYTTDSPDELKPKQ